jgi:hypothetical protein
MGVSALYYSKQYRYGRRAKFYVGHKPSGNHHSDSEILFEYRRLIHSLN